MLAAARGRWIKRPMIVTGFNGKQYKINLSKFSKKKEVSKLAVEARKLLTELYPCHSILEEVLLPGSEIRCGKKLKLDFFLPSLSLGVEVHGPQHYEYTTFFFASKLDFIRAKARDTAKQEWCNLNNIKLVVLKHDEQHKWKEQLGD